MKRKHKFRKIMTLVLVLIFISGIAGYVAGGGGFAACEFVEYAKTGISEVKRNYELQKKMRSLPSAEIVDSVSNGMYAYESLTSTEKIVYDQMLDAILNYREEVTLSTVDGQLLGKIFDCIRADHGELFWIKSYRYTIYQKNRNAKLLSFTPVYTMTQKERDRMQKKIDKKVKRYLKGLDGQADDFEKVCYVYEKLIQNVDYNQMAENSQNIISVFIGEETVCQGYSDAMQYMLGKLGIACMVISGTANDGSHAWNLVKLDGDWYYVDLTWGNSAYHDETVGNVRYVQYDYLNVTDQEILSNHTPDMPFALPVCTADKDNYYVHEGRFFTDFQGDTVDRIGALIREAYENGEQTFSVKFSTDELSKQARNYYLKQYHLRDYCPALKRVYYNTDSQMNVFTIIF